MLVDVDDVYCDEFRNVVVFCFGEFEWGGYFSLFGYFLFLFNYGWLGDIKMGLIMVRVCCVLIW